MARRIKIQFSWDYGKKNNQAEEISKELKIKLYEKLNTSLKQFQTLLLSKVSTIIIQKISAKIQIMNNNMITTISSALITHKYQGKTFSSPLSLVTQLEGSFITPLKCTTTNIETITISKITAKQKLEVFKQILNDGIV